ncbi:hypothetical protein ACFE04_019792 [Oxalis oulophora]
MEHTSAVRDICCEDSLISKLRVGFPLFVLQLEIFLLRHGRNLHISGVEVCFMGRHCGVVVLGSACQPDGCGFESSSQAKQWRRCNIGLINALVMPWRKLPHLENGAATYSQQTQAEDFLPTWRCSLQTARRLLDLMQKIMLQLVLRISKTFLVVRFDIPQYVTNTLSPQEGIISYSDIIANTLLMYLIVRSLSLLVKHQKKISAFGNEALQRFSLRESDDRLPPLFL